MKPTFTLLVLSIITFTLNAQKITKYFDYNWKQCDLQSARYVTYIEWKDSVWQRDDYFIIERKLQMRGFYSDSTTKVPNGKFYYFHPNGKVKSLGKYLYGKKDGVWRSYYADGLMEDSTFYHNGVPEGISIRYHHNGYQSDSSVFNKDGSGTYVSWFDNGTPASAGNYAAGRKKRDKWRYFHKNGTVSCEEIFESGNIVSRMYFNEEGHQVGDSSNTDKAASFPGGPKAWSKFLGKHIYFPDQYKIVNGDKAIVIVEATIDETGAITNIEVVVPFHEAFNQIAIDAFKKSPKWVPAFQHGRNVSYKVSQAVTFEQVEF